MTQYAHVLKFLTDLKLFLENTALGVLTGADSIVHIRCSQSPFFHRIFQKEITAILLLHPASQHRNSWKGLGQPFYIGLKYSHQVTREGPDNSPCPSCCLLPWSQKHTENIWMLLRKLGAPHYSNSKQSTEGKATTGYQCQPTTKNFRQIVVLPACIFMVLSRRHLIWRKTEDSCLQLSSNNSWRQF